MDYASDPYRYALTRPVDTPPGTVWNYSGGSAALISAVLHQATGKTEDVLAQELLFDPLGIHDVAWVRYPGNNEPLAASGLAMRPRDLTKLGQLVLNHGAWDGRQIVPAAWIDASISRKSRDRSSTSTATNGGSAAPWSTCTRSTGPSATVSVGSGCTSCRSSTWSCW
jgi:CubicO group peptidase (beta-lactamase class C family)